MSETQFIEKFFTRASLTGQSDNPIINNAIEIYQNFIKSHNGIPDSDKSSVAKSIQEWAKDTDNTDLKIESKIPDGLDIEIADTFKHFEGVSYDIETGEMCFATSEVIFEDMNLGSFATRINGREKVVRATSINPYPSFDGFEHPHLDKDTRLCLGESSEPLWRAYRENRFFDMFDIINNTLQTYNPESPHRSLTHWRGFECPLCDDSVNPRNIVGCHICDTQFCHECNQYCNWCSMTSCIDHASKCDCGSGKLTCNKCNDKFSCVECGKSMCSTCRTYYYTDKREYCHKECRKKLIKEKKIPEDNSSEPTTVEKMNYKYKDMISSDATFRNSYSNWIRSS